MKRHACLGCGGTIFVPARDNSCVEYLGCPNCVVVAKPQTDEEVAVVEWDKKRATGQVVWGGGYGNGWREGFEAALKYARDLELKKARQECASLRDSVRVLERALEQRTRETQQDLRNLAAARKVVYAVNDGRYALQRALKSGEGVNAAAAKLNDIVRTLDTFSLPTLRLTQQHRTARALFEKHLVRFTTLCGRWISLIRSALLRCFAVAVRAAASSPRTSIRVGPVPSARARASSRNLFRSQMSQSARRLWTSCTETPAARVPRKRTKKGL